jgi:uncharacterized protein (DUF1697 family)
VSESASRHVAFIRNVMVGRANLHRDVLLRIFADAGAVEPRSHFATGNVSFGWDGSDLDGLVASAQDGIAATMGRFEPVFVRRVAALRDAVQREPFRITPIGDVGHRCVTFTESAGHLALPLVSPREDAYIFDRRGTDFMSVTRLVGGRGGNVNRMIEKALACASTTRNWNTVERIVALHEYPLREQDWTLLAPCDWMRS